MEIVEIGKRNRIDSAAKAVLSALLRQQEEGTYTFVGKGALSPEALALTTTAVNRLARQLAGEGFTHREMRAALARNAASLNEVQR